MKKSTFKRVTGEVIPSSVPEFLKEAGYNYAGSGLLAAWVKGDPETSKDLVVVMINDKDHDTLNDVLTRKADGTIDIIPCESLYETFKVHTEARFAEQSTHTLGTWDPIHIMEAKPKFLFHIMIQHNWSNAPGPTRILKFEPSDHNKQNNKQIHTYENISKSKSLVSSC